MKIPYPDDDTTHAAVQKICDKDVLKKESTFSFLRGMTDTLGFRYIFSGILDTVIIAFAVSLVVGIIAVSALLDDPQGEIKTAAVAFALSPLLYMLLFALSYCKEREVGSYAIKMTCKYTVHHLLAYRMFAASLVSVICSGMYAVLLSHRLNAPGQTIICISLSSLFLFALLLIETVIRFQTLFSVVSLCAGWLCVNGLLCWWNIESYASFLQAVPTVVWIAADVIFAVLFWQSYRAYIRRVCGACG